MAQQNNNQHQPAPSQSSDQQGAQRNGSLDQQQEVINQRELESERMEQDDNQRHIQESTLNTPSNNDPSLVDQGRS